ncbi:hypothetical protein C7446_0046 [Kushneria sinocarnis]|uniref:AsmA domain-containing protein n=1 Tax=Kushneria sinocarnis TaxID=595502 RepID=A0A420X055_9GAMM|nr:AsmA family protein [Kushneria sinocarnis]RKR07238.1 hypothetical protein C7446_0046 [Kushneria sinocarnis]
MNRHPVRWISAIVLGVPVTLLGLAVAATVALSLLPLNWLRPTLNEQVSRALQRPFAIRGELRLDWSMLPGYRLPLPILRAGELVLGNPAGWAPTSDEHPPMIRLERLEAGLVLPALAGRRLVITRITLSQPHAELVRRADGRNNWTFAFADDERPAARHTPEAPGWTVDIDDIVFDQGRIHYRDAVLDAELTATLDPLAQSIPYAEIVGRNREGQPRVGTAAADYLFGWQVEGRYKGEPLEGSGRLGGMLSLRQGNQPFPLQIALRSGDTRIRVTGTLTDPLELGALDLQLALEGRSLGDLYALTGVVLPETPPYATEGHLVAKLARPEGSLFEYQEFNATIGGSDLHGTLTYASTEPRPRLSGTLDARRLRMVDLGPLIGADDHAPDAETPAQPPGRVLPVAEFRTERWDRMDADIRFRADRIEHGASLPLSDLDTHIVLDSGELLLDPLHFSMAGGALNTTLRLNGNHSPMHARIDMHARRLQLNQLIPAPGSMQDALGQLNGDATLTGYGNSVAALLGSGNGEIKMLIDNGLISRNLMELAGLHIGNYILGRLFGDEQVRIHCAAADLVLRDGLVRPRVFFIDTETATIEIDGGVDLGSERLDLTVDPQGKGLRVFTLHSPLYVSGTFKNPAPGVQAGPLAARAAAAVALGAIAPPAALLALVAPNSGQQERCSDLLQARLSAQ